MRVSSLGGEPRPLTTLANGEISHRFPQVLPGGKAVLFTASTEMDIGAGATLVALDLASGARTTVHPAATSAATCRAATCCTSRTTPCLRCHSIPGGWPRPARRGG